MEARRRSTRLNGRLALDVVLWAAVLALLTWRVGPQAAAAFGVGGGRGPAPELTVTTLSGDRISLAGLEDRVVVVNFWATWCRVCRLQMSGFQNVWEARRDDGVVVLGLSTELGADARVRSFVEERGVTYPVAVVGHGVTASFGGVRALPTTLVIDRGGRVRHRVEGFFAETALRAAVDRVLAEAPAATPEGGAS